MPELLVVDFEFTMAPSYGRPRAFFPEIIKIGAVVVNPDGILTDKQYDSFVKPHFWPRITKECFGLTGIKQNDINQGVSLEIALYQLKQMVSTNPYFVAWGDADRKVLGTVCRRYGIDYPFKWENYIDLAFEYRKFHQRKNLTSLKTAVQETHQQQKGICYAALDDAVNASLVLKYLISKGWKYEVQALIA